MKIINWILRFLTTATIFFGTIVGVGVFLDSNFDNKLFNVSSSIIWLIISIYLAMYVLRIFSDFLYKYDRFSANNIKFGTFITSCWLTICIFFCIVLRLDFSTLGLSFLVLIFMVPAEILYTLIPFDFMLCSSNLCIFGEILAVFFITLFLSFAFVNEKK